MDVHLFWTGRPLNRLEHWCLQRFQALGYTPRVWTYDSQLEVPRSVALQKAVELIPQDRLFLNRKGSYASFADLFRYTLLARHGGLWSDLDIVCLRHADELSPDSFLVTERNQEGQSVLNNNLIHAASADARAHMAQLAEMASSIPVEQVVWSQLGPQLLQSYINNHPNHGFQILQPDFANPVNWWDVPKAFLLNITAINLRESCFLHLYAERWRRSGYDCSECLEGGQNLETLLAPL